MQSAETLSPVSPTAQNVNSRWFGKTDVRVENVPDPKIINPHDAIRTRRRSRLENRSPRF